MNSRLKMRLQLAQRGVISGGTYGGNSTYITKMKKARLEKL
jgi:hypothetical protein